ncbi:MAG: YciI family protein [Acidobacteria bacterium]|nr:YciI family protein [Acidobacteriota bacterium]MCI0665432.1 YciI family protein [Acidobacteriota bacterium]
MKSQEQWSEHATFMNRLAADGFVVLGGPVDESGDILLVIDAAEEGEINTTLLRDPWSRSGILEIKTIKRWTILLQAEEGAKGDS